jgi:Hexokinase
MAIRSVAPPSSVPPTAHADFAANLQVNASFLQEIVEVVTVDIHSFVYAGSVTDLHVFLAQRSAAHRCAAPTVLVAMQESVDVETVDIPSSVYTGSVTDLYVFIAQRIVAFIRSRGLAGLAATTGSGNGAKESGGKGSRDESGGGGRNSKAAEAAAQALPLGFCFSFPLDQTSVRRRVTSTV